MRGACKLCVLMLALLRRVDGELAVSVDFCRLDSSFSLGTDNPVPKFEIIVSYRIAQSSGSPKLSCEWPGSFGGD